MTCANVIVFIYNHAGSKSANSDLKHDAMELVLGLRLLYA
jgi:hypothetical protein